MSRSASDTASTQIEARERVALEAQHALPLLAEQRRATGFVAVSACRRQISASTLCVKRTAGQGSWRGRFTTGGRKSQTTSVEAAGLRAAPRTRPAYVGERYFADRVRHRIDDVAGRVGVEAQRALGRIACAGPSRSRWQTSRMPSGARSRLRRVGEREVGDLVARARGAASGARCAACRPCRAAGAGRRSARESSCGRSPKRWPQRVGGSGAAVTSGSVWTPSPSMNVRYQSSRLSRLQIASPPSAAPARCAASSRSTPPAR